MIKKLKNPVFIILTLVFTILKLLGFIKWSWIWVLSPIWIPFIAVIGIILVLMLFNKFLK